MFKIYNIRDENFRYIFDILTDEEEPEEITEEVTEEVIILNGTVSDEVNTHTMLMTIDLNTGVVSGMVYIRINFTDLDYKFEVDAPISGSINLETREINAQAGEGGEIKLTGILSADGDKASGTGSEGAVWSVSR